MSMKRRWDQTQGYITFLCAMQLLSMIFTSAVPGFWQPGLSHIGCVQEPLTPLRPFASWISTGRFFKLEGRSASIVSFLSDVQDIFSCRFEPIAHLFDLQSWLRPFGATRRDNKPPPEFQFLIDCVGLLPRILI
jgi:hypothetical protein